MYQDDDANVKANKNKLYEAALEEASKAHLEFRQLLNEEKDTKDVKSNSIKPPVYGKLKVSPIHE